MHEDPQVANYGKQGSGVKLREGLILAIEPMINLGKREIYPEPDGWTVRTPIIVSVHFEHDVCVAKTKPIFSQIILKSRKRNAIIPTYTPLINFIVTD
jgi:methionyl aminopeptidase